MCETSDDLMSLSLVCLSLSVEDLYSGRLYGALDSGFNSVDSGDKRWSGNEASAILTIQSAIHSIQLLFSIMYHSFHCPVCLFPIYPFLKPSDELSDLPLRVAEITREQRQRREREREDHRTGSHVTNGTCEMTSTLMNHYSSDSSNKLYRILILNHLVVSF